MLADQPWWHAVARPINSTAVHALLVWLAMITVGMRHAKIAMAVLRARFTEYPRLISAEERYPPKIDPTSAITYTVVRYGISFVPRMPCSDARNFGSQNR